MNRTLVRTTAPPAPAPAVRRLRHGGAGPAAVAAARPRRAVPAVPAAPAATAVGPPRSRGSSRCRRPSPPRCPPSRPSPIWTCPTPLLAALDRAGRDRAVPDPGARPCRTPSPAATCWAAGAPAPARPSPSAWPLLARTAGQRAEPRQPLALVLVPTRELAQQVTDALTPYARAAEAAAGHRRRRHVDRPAGQRAARRRRGRRRHPGPAQGPHRPRRLPAGPGRASPSWTRPTRWPTWASCRRSPRCWTRCAPSGQRMLFSATLDRNVDLLVRRYLTDPVVHSVDPSAGAVTTMEHHVLHVHGADKHAATTRDRRPRRPGDHVPGHQARRRPADPATC